MTFKDYLKEVMLDIDQTDPHKARQDLAMARRKNPTQMARIQRQKAQAEEDAADAEGNTDPNVKREIMLKKRLAHVQMQNARKKQGQNSEEI